MFRKRKKDILTYKVSSLNSEFVKESLDQWRDEYDIEGTEELNSKTLVSSEGNFNLIDLFDGVYYFCVLYKYKKINHKKIQKEAKKITEQSWAGEKLDTTSELFQIEYDLNYEDLLKGAIIDAKVYQKLYPIILSPDDNLLIAESSTPSVILNYLKEELSIKLENYFEYPSFEELDINQSQTQRFFLNWLYKRSQSEEDIKVMGRVKTKDSHLVIWTNGEAPYDWHKDRQVLELDIRLYSKYEMTLKEGKLPLYSVYFREQERKYTEGLMGYRDSFLHLKLCLNAFKKILKTFSEEINPEDLL